MAHAPSDARALRRRLRDGETNLVGEITALPPAHSAPLLATLSCHPVLEAPERRDMVAASLTAATQVDRWSQKTETWAAVLRALGATHVHDAMDAAVGDVEQMPDGAWVTEAATAIGSLVDAAGRRRLLDRVLRNPGEEAVGAKALVAIDPALAAAISDHPDADLRRRVLAVAGDRGAALAAAWEVPEPDARWEALRAVAWDAQLMEIDALAAHAEGHEPEDAARFLCALAARADRLGSDPGRYLADADRFAALMDDERRRGKVERKIAQARHKAGLVAEGAPPTEQPAAETPGPAEGRKTSAPSPPHEADVDLPPRTGHGFVLVDGYKGGLGVPHLRAAGRGAALCAAFGHDLWLVGFPVEDAASLVEAAAGQTEIGEDAAPMQALYAAGRLHVAADPEALSGTLVATTPHVDRVKAGPLPDGPLALLVGLGKNGLPGSVLAAAQFHYELTGRGVSLETATAMGILADRLARER